jgi:hypothetical protein
MRRIILLTIALLHFPLFAGLNCLSEYKGIEYVGWHSVECDCPCTYIKGRKCVECGHLQDARPLTIVIHSIKKIAQHSKSDEPQTIKEAVNNLVQKYIKNENR